MNLRGPRAYCVGRMEFLPVRKFGFLFSHDQKRHRGGAPRFSENSSVMPPFRISRVRTRDDIDAAAELFAAYAAELPIDLQYQDFGAEPANLPGKYDPPEGELLVAWDERDRPIGCVGMWALDYSNRCEMKRLYLVPEARSLGLGKALLEAIITVARSRGYSELVLDLQPTMQRAANLYRNLGFRRIDGHYKPAPADTMFMALDLTPLARVEQT